MLESKPHNKFSDTSKIGKYVGARRLETVIDRGSDYAIILPRLGS